MLAAPRSLRPFPACLKRCSTARFTAGPKGKKKQTAKKSKKKVLPFPFGEAAPPEISPRCPFVLSLRRRRRTPSRVIFICGVIHFPTMKR